VKKLVRHRSFNKSYKSRVLNNRKLDKKFRERLQDFINGERGYPVNDHALTGDMVGYRSFSVANDLRVIYTETDDQIIFVDIGSHNQVYGP
jgi:addiction module RelE/StbE family toxin